MARKVYHFCIADFDVEMIFADDGINTVHLVSSMLPFVTAAPVDRAPLLFSLTVDDTLPPVPKADRERIRDVDTGNGHTLVDRLTAGGYQFIMKNVAGADCCLLQTNADFSRFSCALRGSYNMRAFGLNSALMIAFAYAASRHQTLLLHASLVRQDGYGYAFVAKSGTGKSTQVSMWLRHLPGCDMMNDDNPIVRIIDGQAYIYGSPWSGKTPCYRRVKAPLGAVTNIVRDKENRVEPLDAVHAFAALLPACASMKWDEATYRLICNTIGRVIECTGIYALHCLPDKESAIVCNNTIKVRPPQTPTR